MWIPNIFKTKYQLVKTEIISVIVKNNLTLSEEPGKIYFYLYESKSRKRMIEWKKTVDSNNNFDPLKEYTEKIYPWLKGVDFDDIPSYWEVVRAKKETKVRGLYKLILSK